MPMGMPSCACGFACTYIGISMHRKERIHFPQVGFVRLDEYKPHVQSRSFAVGNLPAFAPRDGGKGGRVHQSAGSPGAVAEGIRCTASVEVPASKGGGEEVRRPGGEAWGGLKCRAPLRFRLLHSLNRWPLKVGSFLFMWLDLLSQKESGSAAAAPKVVA